MRPRAPRAPKAVGGTAKTPSAICESTSDTPALATMLPPLGALQVLLQCLHHHIFITPNTVGAGCLLLLFSSMHQEIENPVQCSLAG